MFIKSGDEMHLESRKTIDELKVHCENLILSTEMLVKTIRVAYNREMNYDQCNSFIDVARMSLNEIEEYVRGREHG